MPGVEDMRRGFGTIHRFDYGGEVGVMTIMEIAGTVGIVLNDEDKEWSRADPGRIEQWLAIDGSDEPTHTIEEDE